MFAVVDSMVRGLTGYYQCILFPAWYNLTVVVNDTEPFEIMDSLIITDSGNKTNSTFVLPNGTAVTLYPRQTDFGLANCTTVFSSTDGTNPVAQNRQ